MTYATTFSGIGGWEIGLDACGWDLKWQCEREPFCQALLKERFGVPIYGDITTLVEDNPEQVDVLIGSPPCQPFSLVGPRRGTSDERHLYPSFLRAVSFLKPRWVLMEQVPAILSDDRGRTFGQYIGGLAALGYDLVWHCIPASAVGARHIRDRVWIMAYSKCNSFQGGAINGKEGRIKSREKQLARLLFPCSWPEIPEAKACRNDDGLPSDVDRNKGLGNAVVPQIPYLIGQAINEIEKEN